MEPGVGLGSAGRCRQRDQAWTLLGVRLVEVQNQPGQARIFEDGALIAAHPVLEGRNRRRLDPSHRTARPREQAAPRPPSQRPLVFYAAVGQRLADSGARPRAGCSTASTPASSA